MLGKQIAEARKRKNWTQRRLADEAGVDPQNISKIERGKHTPTGKTLEKIAAALGMSVALRKSQAA